MRGKGTSAQNIAEESSYITPRGALTAVEASNPREATSRLAEDEHHTQNETSPRKLFEQ